MKLFKLWDSIHHLLDDGDGITMYIPLNHRYELVSMNNDHIFLLENYNDGTTVTFGIYMDSSNFNLQYEIDRYGDLNVDDHKIIKEIFTRR